MKFSSLLLVVYSFFIILCNGCKEMPASKIRDKDSVSLLVSKKLYKWVRPSRQLGKDSVWSDDWKFVADSVFHGHHQLLKYNFEKYNNDTCVAMETTKHYLPDFDGILSIGIIKKSKPIDSVFVLPRLRWCDNDGDAYYFTDTSLPRLETDSYCCHPNNLFNIGDIDEDGIAEIAQWNSSCVSRFKSLLVWSLKANHWKKVGQCTILADDFDKMKQRIRKIKKGEFEMYEVADYVKPRKGEWFRFKM